MCCLMNILLSVFRETTPLLCASLQCHVRYTQRTLVFRPTSVGLRAYLVWAMKFFLQAICWCLHSIACRRGVRSDAWRRLLNCVFSIKLASARRFTSSELLEIRDYWCVGLPRVFRYCGFQILFVYWCFIQLVYMFFGPRISFTDKRFAHGIFDSS